MADSEPSAGLAASHERTAGDAHWQVRIRSNFSLSSKQLLRVIMGLSLLTLGLAAYPASLGFWPVLLIAGIQAGIVALVLFQAWRSAWSVETISWQSGQLTICRETVRGVERHELDGNWARLQVVKPSRPLAMPQIILVSQGRGIEVGRSLNGEQRKNLAANLRKQLARCSAWQQPVAADPPGS